MLKPASALFQPGLVTRILSRSLIRPFRRRFQSTGSEAIEHSLETHEVSERCSLENDQERRSPKIISAG